MNPTVVSPAEWQAVHERLLAREKALTRASDALAAERRRLPAMRFPTDHAFAGPDGAATLSDLFDGRRQLITYCFMVHPGPEPCSGCAMFTDNLVHLAHLHARDTSFALVSDVPYADIAAIKTRMGWNVPWYAVGGDFYEAAGVQHGSFGLNVLLRDGDDVFRTYFTSSRGVEAIGTVWSLLDRTPFGRQETWEDSPPGTPQGEPYGWWQLHDEYGGSRVAE